MIVCNCRDIRESDYPDKEELHDRIYCDDVVCGKCLEEFVDVDSQKQTSQLHIFINKCGGSYEKENCC